MKHANKSDFAVGDVVMVPCTILSLDEAADGCVSASVETVHGRASDGQKTTIADIDTGMMELHTVPDDSEMPDDV